MGKSFSVKTCSDLAKHFCAKLVQTASDYDEIHLAFVRYDLHNSPKEATRKIHAGLQKALCYKVSDSTPLAKSQ